jgi:hypothetical protein
LTIKLPRSSLLSFARHTPRGSPASVLIGRSRLVRLETTNELLS